MTRMLRAFHRAAHGVAADLTLYVSGAVFAGFTAAASTLPAHRAWGGIALAGYAVACVLALAPLVLPRLARAGTAGRRNDAARHLTGGAAVGGAGWPGDAAGRLYGDPARIVVAGVAWAGSTIVPLLVQAVQRAGGAAYRAQEEVTVVELAAARLLEHGTPYLSREQIAAAAEPLLGYLPYQPGMTVFGLPRALAGAAWWTDARVWFALATAAAVVGALRLLYRAGVPVPLLIRAGQAVTVLPVCALTLATGGDDLPVLALTLLALALAACRRWTGSGLAVGVAAALKLFAWPVAVVLVGYAWANGRRSGTRLTVPAVGLPALVLAPFVALGPGAVAENLVSFPLGRGLVKSPAASPLPGHLIATGLPYGRFAAIALLVAAAVGIGLWLLRRPPRTAGEAAGICAAGLLVAILLMPATRFGYLLYPAAYAVWAVALARVRLPAGTGPLPVPSEQT